MERSESFSVTLTEEVRREIKLTTKDIDDIMTAALNAGIGHWCVGVGIMANCGGSDCCAEQIARGGILNLRAKHLDALMRVDDGPLYDCMLDLNRFLMGLKDACDVAGIHERYDILQSDGTLNVSSIDPACADEIIQFSIWGDVIYDR